jgi:signal transduction histidine kinase/CheY-like chemotaxis protein
MKNKLQLLLNEVLRMDNKVRSAVIRNRVDDPALIAEQTKQVRQSVQELKHLLVTDTTRKLWQQLYLLSEEKIQRSKLVLETLSRSGKQAAEDFINTQKGVRLTESITRVAKQLEYARESYLTYITGEIDNHSQRAKRLGFIMAALAIAIVLMAFWFIINRVKRQQHLIEQLNESERLQREASRVKEHFIANMSHEIRTPMNAILGFVNLLKKQPLDKKTTLYIDSIHQSSEKLLAIINDVLDLSKIEAGMMRIEKSLFSFTELMHAVASMFQGKATEKNLQVVYQLDKKIPDSLNGDSVRITQVLVNLISNAIKFTEKGTINVNATLLQQSSNSILLGLQVKDDGIGIAPEQLNKIFDRFTQAEESTTRRYGGTGLGLSIVQQIVTLLGGSIDVESTPGRGTVFNVQIPLDIATPAINPDHFEVTGYKQTAKPATTRILVVEDNPMNQMLMEHLLEAWHYEFSIAENGLLAVEMIRKEKFSMVLMDVQMPEMDGYTATRIIRKELGPDLPVIAMTAHAFEGEREKCIAAGMDDYLAKPIREQELADMIEKYSGLQTANHKNSIGPDTLNNYPNAIDLAYLRDISGGNEVFEKNILKQFLLQAPEEIHELDHAFNEKNWKQVKAKAHTLKSTTSFLGLQSLLAKDLQQLEQTDALTINSPQMRDSLQKVMRVCNEAIREAKEMLTNSEVTS